QITADFTYVRMHGPGEIAYAGSYAEAALKRWARQIESWRLELNDVYVYFNNDIGGCAVKDAGRLRRLVSRQFV
ncbi:MAG TPA: DUF72 domain-containing protein, partial [Pyrinomonadaceae bacterium]|nr:DUF72 domain-containing protein [Pyrinomonadaceae bacterium]